eukprot:COSAG01_NODE_404_length_17467_cov_69.758650_3_plen_48_part_00
MLCKRLGRTTRTRTEWGAPNGDESQRKGTTTDCCRTSVSQLHHVNNS